MKLSAEGSEFFFYYSLLGNDITSEPFHNLLSPDFEPERASVRIRSSKQILKAFLSQQPSLQVSAWLGAPSSQLPAVYLYVLVLSLPQIHLCCGNHSLGSTDISLSALAGISTDLDNKAATLEGAFLLQPPKRVKQTLPALPTDLQPTLGVAVTLRREEVTLQVNENKYSEFISKTFMIVMLSALNYMRWMKDESLHSQQFGGRAELCIEPQTRFHVFFFHCGFITSWCIGCFCYALWWTWVVVWLSHYMSCCMVLCPFSSLWGIKRLLERCLLLFLLLNRDLEALLQSLSLQGLLHILVLAVLLSLLLHLIQRAKQRVCWMSSGTAESRQDWQVGLKISSCHFHTRSLKSLELSLFTGVQLQIWRLQHRCPDSLRLQRMVECHPSVFLLPKSPSPPPLITTASLWTFAAWETSAYPTPLLLRSGETLYLLSAVRMSFSTYGAVQRF